MVCRYFAHNDMADLARLVREVEQEEGGEACTDLRSPTRRRYVVTEGA